MGYTSYLTDCRIRKLGNFRKVSKFHKMIAQRPSPPPNATSAPCPQRHQRTTHPQTPAPSHIKPYIPAPSPCPPPIPH